MSKKPDFYKGSRVDNIASGKIENMTSNFLEEQINFSPEKWDLRFKKLIKKLKEENQKRLERDRKIARGEPVEEEKPMSLKELSKAYLSYLALKEEQLKGKRILDLGCGSDGYFIRYLLKYGITSEAYGLDLGIDEKLIEPEHLGHFYQGEYRGEFPVKDLDYIISRAAVSKDLLGSEFMKEKFNIVKNIISNCLAVLKEDEEIRFSPILKASVATPDGLGKGDRENWNKFLKEIAEELKIEYEFKPVSVGVATRDNDIFLRYVLIIRKKMKLEIHFR